MWFVRFKLPGKLAIVESESIQMKGYESLASAGGRRGLLEAQNALALALRSSHSQMVFQIWVEVCMPFTARRWNALCIRP